jgi:hypothetical protein
VEKMQFFRTGMALTIPSVVSIQSHQDSHSMTSSRARLHEDSNFRQKQNKLGHVYLMTPSGTAEKAALTSGFMTGKMQDYKTLKVELAMLKSEIGTQNGEKPSKK